MKTSQGKLAVLAFVLLLAALLLAPMRAGQEDVLSLRPGTLKLSPGGSYRLSCTLRSDDPHQSMSYQVEDAGIATIGLDGTVYAHAPGETVITARASGGASAKTKIIVDGTPLRELRLNTREIYLEKGQFSGLSVSYNSDASDARLQWISDDESVALVDSAGRIEGVGGGETYVRVVAPNGMSAAARVFVNVDSTAVHIAPNHLTVGVGAQVPLKVSYLPEDSTDGVARWSTSDPRVLTVDSNGVLHATGEGTAYVSLLTLDGLTAGMEVVVEPAPKDVQLNLARAGIERGEILDLDLNFLERDGSVKENVSHLVTWVSSDESVAVVDAQGVVTGLKSGSCEITAHSDGMAASCRLDVSVSVHEIHPSMKEVYLLREQAGEPIQLGWTLSPADPDDPTIHFASSNEQVAKVSDTGLVQLTGGYGSATVTLSSPSGAAAQVSFHVVTRLPEESAAPGAVHEAAAEAANPSEVINPFEAETAVPAATALPALPDGATAVG